MAGAAALYRMVTDDHVCPFGLKAKDLLERRGFDIDDRLLESRQAAEELKRKLDVETTPQVFIGGKRIGGYDALRRHLGLETGENSTTYQPIAAVFGTTLLMALAGTWVTLGTVVHVRTVEWFVAFSMCVLAILKLQDLEAFSNRFITYDLLGRRVVRYAYVYPFAEAFAGIGMLAGLWPPLVAGVAGSIGAIGAVSVIKAVYLERRELHCACVGGDTEVPLGAISLSENLAMVAMAIWMLVR